VSAANEDELRAMVRESIARVLASGAAGFSGPQQVLAGAPHGHASHHRYVLQESDGPCLIEPTVPCNHCGYCQSHGH